MQVVNLRQKVVNMYFGYYEHNLDDKGRLMIPSKLREGLSSGSPLYVLRGFDGCLSIYNENAFQKLYASLEEYSYNQKDSRNYMRALLSSVTQLNIDKIGRIQIPVTILEKYHISREVAVIGVGDHIELWDKKAYQEYELANDSAFEEIADKLVKING